jgi:hypothetical protein
MSGKIEPILDTLSSKAVQALQACWSPRWLILLIAIFGSLIFRDFESTTKGVKAPIVGRWPLEPYFLTGLRFKRWSMLHLSEGYGKVESHPSCGKCDMMRLY